eukprot:s178_g68.t1
MISFGNTSQCCGQGRVVGFGGTGKAVFFGLIRDHKPNIQTSFLEQTPFKSLAIDLRYPGQETMELSTASILPTFEGGTLQRVKLVDPRRWGDPVKHYAALATLRVGGKAVTTKSSSGKVLVIFDTGTTGASLTTSLYDAYLRVARQSASSGTSWSQARQIEAVFDSAGSNVVFSMYMGKHPNYGLGLDLVTPIDEMTWAGGSGHLRKASQAVVLAVTVDRPGWGDGAGVALADHRLPKTEWLAESLDMLWPWDFALPGGAIIAQG